MLKPGDKVVMNDRYHVGKENRGKSGRYGLNRGTAAALWWLNWKEKPDDTPLMGWKGNNGFTEKC